MNREANAAAIAALGRSRAPKRAYGEAIGASGSGGYALSAARNPMRQGVSNGLSLQVSEFFLTVE